ncbi:cellulase family glycosylhydrolase [Marinimicrobium sp. C2-29]|uniref:cellulase family glycosylhydrolase n=1 Tax=Marinimicrobium sp. C2-29 TaxID=3139825 RepID=UPI00313A289C
MITTKYKGNGLAVAMLSLGLAAVSQGAAAQADNCEYVITNEWGSGATAAIRINNNGSTAINGWDVSWAYDNNVVTNSWNADVSGDNPYTATDLGWNGTIQPGESVEIGMQIDANGGSVETPQLNGAACEGDGGDTSSSAPASSSSSAATSSEPATDGQMCDWYGTTYELCDSQNSGWGWEDGQSCIGATTCSDQPDPYGIIGGSTSSAPASSSSSAPESSSSSSVPASSSSSVAVSSSSSESSSSVPSSSSSSAPSTDGTFRVDDSGNITQNGEEYPVQCSAWFGLEGQHEPVDAENNPDGAPMELYVGNMWWVDSGRTIQQTMDEITAQGINTIRLPIAPQTLDPNDPQGTGDVREGGVLKNHESVQQDNARQAMEDFIVQADENGINVIIDIHSCSNYVGWRAGRLDATPPYADAERENYDFKREGYSCGAVDDPDVQVDLYNEELWLDDLREIAGLSEQLGVDNIMAIDIFNEPWDYTWAEWKELSETAYQAIDEVNSDVLIMVEGIAGGTSAGEEVPHGSEETNPNWGENLYPFADAPLDIPKERLILSPHTYGPSVFVQKQFMDPAQPECEGLEGDAAGEADCNIVIDPERIRAGWDEHFGYLADQGYAMIIGEFGGHVNWPADAPPRHRTLWDHIDAGIDMEWQNALVDYMVEKNIEGCYWSTNPESEDTGGLYKHAYDPVSNTDAWGTWEGFEEEKWNLLFELWDN